MKKIFSLLTLALPGVLLSASFGQTLPQPPRLDARLACFEGNPTIELLITSKARIQVQGGALRMTNDSSYVVSQLTAGQRINILQLTAIDTLIRAYVVPVVEPKALLQPLVSSSTTCAGSEPAVLRAFVAEGQTADWYDARAGGKLLASGQTTLAAARAGTYYAEARDPALACLGVSSGRGAGTVIVQRTLCPVVLVKRTP